MPKENEMSLQIGDWVRIVDGCEEYGVTTAGSIGVIEHLFGGSVAVDFREYGPTTDANRRPQSYSVEAIYLEKINPPAHLVGETLELPPRAKTREEKIEIFSRKIDSEEKLYECQDVLGMPQELYGGSWWVARDNIRVAADYFKRITPPIGCTAKSQDDYLHVSKCKTKVAFYENEDKQKRDICTVMGYGRYLTKYHPELDNEQVKAAVNTFNYDHGVAPEVFFSEDQDEFIRAINHGPSESCMQGLDFRGHIHPAAVYAAGDIKVAWLERDGDVTARTLINKETKAFSRVYGDSAKLKPLLEAMGYSSQVGALAGCRLLKIDNKHGEGYIMPYVDAGIGTGGGALRFYDDGSCFMLSDGKGESTCVGNENDGVTAEQEPEYCCDDCGCGCDEDELTYTYHETSVCERCLRNSYTYALVGRNHNEYARDDDCTYVHCMEENVHNDYLCDLDVVMDEFSDKYIDIDEAVQTLSEQWADIRSCFNCGTNEDGDAIWLHDDEVHDAEPGELYKRGDDFFWHMSSEIVEWKMSVSEEDHDPEEFVLVRQGKVESKVMAADVETHAKPPLETPSQIKVGDVVKVVNHNGYGPVGHIGKVLEICGAGINVETPGGCVRYVSGSGWMHDMCDVSIVRKADEPQTWKAEYLRMQERGIKFTNEGMRNNCWNFDDPQYMYKIDPSQTPPSDWQAIYKEAQASGVEFDCYQDLSNADGYWKGPNSADYWNFDGRFDQYRLKETT